MIVRKNSILYESLHFPQLREGESVRKLQNLVLGMLLFF